MNFYRKVSLSIFLTAFLFGATLLWIGLAFVRDEIHQLYVERYSRVGELFANSLLDRETAVEKLGRNAALYLEKEVKTRGSIPSDQELGKLADKLGVSLFAIANSQGTFVRDTMTPPDKRTYKLFDFCGDYRKLFTGGSDIQTTPILPSFPYRGPFKFIMVAGEDRNLVFEAGIHLSDLAEFLEKTLQTDPNLQSLALLSPSGFNFGTLTRDGKFEDGGQISEKEIQLGQRFPQPGTFELVKKIKVMNPQCCECKMKGVGGDDAYFYYLKLRASTDPLRALLTKARSVALGLVALLALFSAVLAHYLASHLVRRIQVVDQAVQEVNDFGVLSKPIRIPGSDEVASLGRNFNRMIRSLSDFKQRQIELEKVHATSELARQVAHDIRSPVAAMSMIARTESGLSDSARELVTSATHRIENIANTLLDESRRSSGQLQEDITVGEVIHRVLAEKKAQHRESGFPKVHLDLGGESPIFVHANYTEFCRVISNLLDNAIEAAGASGEVRISAKTHEHRVLLRISDTGPGFTPQAAANFGRKGFTTKGQNGNGLGLSFSASFASELGGTLRLLDSSTGAEVELNLPAADRPSWYIQEVILSPDQRVLVVDDDRRIYDLWKIKLVQSGLIAPNQLVYFESGEALSKRIDDLRNQPILVLMDFDFGTVPDLSQGSDSELGLMDGLSWIERLQLRDCSVLVTGRSYDREVQDRAVKLGVKVLSKSEISRVSFRVS